MRAVQSRCCSRDDAPRSECAPFYALSAYATLHASFSIFYAILFHFYGDAVIRYAISWRGHAAVTRIKIRRSLYLYDAYADDAIMRAFVYTHAMRRSEDGLFCLRGACMLCADARGSCRKRYAVAKDCCVLPRFCEMSRGARERARMMAYRRAVPRPQCELLLESFHVADATPRDARAEAAQCVRVQGECVERGAGRPGCGAVPPCAPRGVRECLYYIFVYYTLLAPHVHMFDRCHSFACLCEAESLLPRSALPLCFMRACFMRAASFTLRACRAQHMFITCYVMRAMSRETCLAPTPYQPVTLLKSVMSPADVRPGGFMLPHRPSDRATLFATRRALLPRRRLLPRIFLVYVCFYATAVFHAMLALFCYAAFFAERAYAAYAMP